MGNPTVPTKKSPALVYIDNSNIWINTMSYSARRLSLLKEIEQDQRVRINVAKMLNIVMENHTVERCVLYGSEPPAVQQFWENVAKCTVCRVEVQVSKKSSFNGRQREVDQRMNLDIGVDILVHRKHTISKGTIILFSGSGGMISAVRRALDFDWDVEIWSYERSLAKVYLDEVAANPKVKIVYLDEYFDQLAFYAYEFKNKLLPREMTFVISFQNLPKELELQAVEIFSKEATNLLKIPISGLYITNHEERINPTQIPTKNLALVCTVGNDVLKEDARNENKTPDQYSLNDIDFLKIIQLLDVCTLSKPPASFNADILRHRLETSLPSIIKEIADSIHSKKIDFNIQVYRKAKADLINYEYFAKIHNNNMNPTLERLLTQYNATIRTAPQFFQGVDPTDDDDEIDPSMEDLGGDGFSVVSRKSPKKKSQKYSDPCKYAFRCSKGKDCQFAHSKKEKDYFKVQPDPYRRSGYKHSPCTHYMNGKCKFMGKDSYKCPFAHGYYCSNCKIDHDGGHNPETCPFSRSRESSHHSTPRRSPPRR